MLLFFVLMILGIHLLLARELIRGSRRIDFLRQVPVQAAQQRPAVTIIAAARNEERHLHQAVLSLLNQDCPDLEVIIVNDRSTDRSGAILDQLAQQFPALRVIHIDSLPFGWLGKNHALWVATQQAGGEWLLFTDADVMMTPDCLPRALSYAESESLDHLAVGPEAHMPSFLLNAFGLTFGYFFGLFTRPWKAPDPRSRAHIGIGAFNLVRHSIYNQVGGHRTIALRPDDDLKLGKIIKQAGYRQKLAYGAGLIQVEWYSTVPEVIRGLEKNLFAGADYRLGLTLGGILFNLLVFLLPWPALLLTHGLVRISFFAACLIMILVAADGARFHGFNRWTAVAFPLTVALFTFIVLRTLIVTLVQGGIYWRGTFYALKELKKNRV
ncbi:MAG: glycosyltransferase [Desulfuromonadales bacterium]|nr:glycosyltransferase [Desulfuromonadales bacterium]MBN2791108.1 glycosyltransferase [Desulfuromonadales bacterium]